MAARRKRGRNVVSGMAMALRKFHIGFDSARIEARLRWSAYRGAGVLGAPGLIAAALLLAALGTELALVRPKLAQQRDSLARIARQRLAYGGIGQPSGKGKAAVAVQEDADLPRILALIDRHGMAVHEVKYRQVAAAAAPKGAKGASGPRIAMALPTSGSYAQFHELISGLAAFRGVRAESFTLKRNLPTERMLAIDLNLSLPAPRGAASPNAGEGGAAGRGYRDLFPEQDRRRDIEAAQPPEPPPPPPAPQAPPLPFRVIGVWTDEVRRRIVLGRGGGNDDTVIVCERCESADAGIGPGARLFGDYRLRKIEPERLTFTYLPLSMQQTIAIGK